MISTKQRNQHISNMIKRHNIAIHVVDEFAYSTGMSNYGFPEIIITTMSNNTQGALINYFFEKWVNEGVNLNDIEPMFEKKDGSDALMRFDKLCLSGELVDNYVCQTINYYDEYTNLAPNGVSFVQLVFADNNDRFPDEPNYDHTNIPQKTFKKLVIN